MFTPTDSSVQQPADRHLDVELSAAVKAKALRAATRAGVRVEDFVAQAVEEKVAELEAEQQGEWILSPAEQRTLLDLLVRPQPESEAFRQARLRARALFGRPEP